MIDQPETRFSGYALVPWTREAVDRMVIDDNTARYLTSAGLPVGVDWIRA